MAIPKVIHYCWFGKGKISDEHLAYINAWKKICPDYEICKWDESNYDIYKSPFTRYAVEKKAWAFLSDYARLDIVNEHGGIYLDVDVELIKNYDEFIEEKSFFGIEKDFDKQLYVNPGLGFGSVSNNEILEEIMDSYDQIGTDENIEFITIPVFIRPIFECRGFVQKNRIQRLPFGTIYPSDYFAPMNSLGKLRKTDNTVSIHHYGATWLKNDDEIMSRAYRKCVFYFGKTAGELLFQVYRRLRNK